jgi:hypothetical protein
MNKIKIDICSCGLDMDISVVKKVLKKAAFAEGNILHVREWSLRDISIKKSVVIDVNNSFVCKNVDIEIPIEKILKSKPEDK